MIALASSERLTKFVQSSRLGAALARRYTAGGEPASALVLAESLARDRAIRGSLYALGEYVSSSAKIGDAVAAQLAIVERLAGSSLDVHLTVDPAQIGQVFDAALARRNAFAVAEAVAAAAAAPARLKATALGMEDASSVDATITLYDELSAAGLPVALTLQAYLRRTEADLARQIERGGRVRLVKGAFLGPAATSFVRREELQANWRRLIDLMLSRRAHECGFRPSIATHDDALQLYAIERAAANGWASDQWEIEMLLGVRDRLAAALAAAGRRVRLFLPSGRDWWPYAIRRIGENPGNAWLLARSLVSRG